MHCGLPLLSEERMVGLAVSNAFTSQMRWWMCLPRGFRKDVLHFINVYHAFVVLSETKIMFTWWNLSTALSKKKQPLASPPTLRKDSSDRPRT